MNGPRVAVISDDAAFATDLKLALAGDAIDVVTGGPGMAADVAADSSIVILDARAGQRPLSTLGPVIVVAAGADRDTASEWLEAGADDVVTRPERVKELVARIRAVLRRQRANRGDVARSVPDGPWVGAVMRYGPVELDVAGHEVRVGSRRATLTRTQFELLELLLLNSGLVLTRGVLMDRVWGAQVVAENALEVQIRRLREVIEDDPRHPSHLRTVRGVGYVFGEANQPSMLS